MTQAGLKSNSRCLTPIIEYSVQLPPTGPFAILKKPEMAYEQAINHKIGNCGKYFTSTVLFLSFIESIVICGCEKSESVEKIRRQI